MHGRQCSHLPTSGKVYPLNSFKHNFFFINTTSHFSVSQLISSKSVHWNSVSDSAINPAPFSKNNKLRRNSDSQYITCSVARYLELICSFPLKENLIVWIHCKSMELHSGLSSSICNICVVKISSYNKILFAFFEGCKLVILVTH